MSSGSGHPVKESNTDNCSWERDRRKLGCAVVNSQVQTGFRFLLSLHPLAAECSLQQVVLSSLLHPTPPKSWYFVCVCGVYVACVCVCVHVHVWCVCVYITQKRLLNMRN